MHNPLEQRIALACRLKEEFPLQPLQDRPALRAAQASAIPSRCFQTAEIRQFGRSHHATLLELRERNPELKFLLFDASRRDAYMAEHWHDHPIGNLYRRARFGAMRADIFRYCIVFDQGGFYLDINKLLLLPLQTFVQEGNHGLISYESNWCQLPAPPVAANRLLHPDRYIVQWCFGFSAGHELLRQMINNICLHAPNYEGKSLENPGEAIRSLTGPGLFTKTVRDYFENETGQDINQAGIDFHHQLRCPAEREVMYLRQPHYKTCRNQPILETPSDRGR